MRSRVYVGTVMHARRAPVEHAFRYPVFVLALDVDELRELDDSLRLFSCNRAGLFSLHEADYLGARDGDLRGKLQRRITAAGEAFALDRIELVTTPRVLGHAFNPVSFYYCRGSDGELSGVVAEVNNTFGEGHVYVLPAAEARFEQRETARFLAAKTFHVSPFNDMEGDYAFRFAPLGDRLDVRIDILRDDRRSFVSRIEGGARPLDDRTLLRLAVTYPCTAALALPRILWQAYKLHYRRGLPVFSKPEPSGSNTFEATGPAYISEFSAPRRGTLTAGRGGLASRLCSRLVTDYLSRLRQGRILLTGAAVGAPRAFGDPRAELSATLNVHEPRFFRRAVAGGDVGFAESYMEGDWDCDRLADLLLIFAVNRDELDDLSLATALPRRLLDRLYHLTRRNTLAGNRRNIQDHYDLGNDFFRLFLDPTMTYSCGLFPSGRESLEEAQRLKIRTILDKADLQPGHHVLEIGSGWGSLALEAARRYGCRVTTLTLSEQQKSWVERAVTEAGLEEQVDVRITDYRAIEGSFDRVVSVEMLEAVGHDNLARYFAACDRLLHGGGRAVIQVITIRDDLYDDYRRGCDFIQRYIFPGGHLPCWRALTDALQAAPGLRVHNVENIGHHYATTLQAWRRAFSDNARQVRDMGFDRAFRRRWSYYFSYCEAGFRARSLGTLQIVLDKAAPALAGSPLAGNQIPAR